MILLINAAVTTLTIPYPERLHRKTDLNQYIRLRQWTKLLANKRSQCKTNI